MRTVLALVLLVPLTAMADGTPRQAPQRRVIELTAERFEFWPPQITLQEGEEVDLRIRSDDTAHGFRIAATQTSVTVPKRGQGTVVVTFRAEKAGRYVFECNRMCGAGHNFMRGEIVVRGPAAAGGGR